MALKFRVKVENNNEDLMPVKAHVDDAAFDIKSRIDITINPGERTSIPTGIYLELTSGYRAAITPRSGLAIKFGITIVNSPGIIDAGYRGEICVILLNTGNKPFSIARGDRIAQMMIEPVLEYELECVNELNTTERGIGGFGSTGISNQPFGDVVPITLITCSVCGTLFEDSVDFKKFSSEPTFVPHVCFSCQHKYMSESMVNDILLYFTHCPMSWMMKIQGLLTNMVNIIKNELTSAENIEDMVAEIVGLNNFHINRYDNEVVSSVNILKNVVDRSVINILPGYVDAYNAFCFALRNDTVVSSLSYACFVNAVNYNNGLLDHINKVKTCVSRLKITDLEFSETQLRFLCARLSGDGRISDRTLIFNYLKKNTNVDTTSFEKMGDTTLIFLIGKVHSLIEFCLRNKEENIPIVTGILSRSTDMMDIMIGLPLKQPITETTIVLEEFPNYEVPDPSSIIPSEVTLSGGPSETLSDTTTEQQQ